MGLVRVFKNGIRSCLRWVITDHQDRAPAEYSNMPSVNPLGSLTKSSGIGISDRNNGMNFTIYNATGGKVVQFSSYDIRTDRAISNLYVITDKDDLGEELGQIITRENLSR